MEFEFRHVYFKYPNSTQYVIKDLSLKLNMGEKIALVGQNGSGKSTLIKLLLRYYDPTEGEILLNGVNIKLYQLDQYRKLFSSMFQDPLMYMLTIRENITLSNVANDGRENDSRFEQLLTDLHINEIDGSHLQMNKFYGKQFFSDGYILSKGQQQKIFAARTLYRDARVYILDEPAVSMDALSEQDFLCSLEKYTNSKAVIYITHRYHNLRKMDRIIVLDSGMVIEEGTHESLINIQGLYSEMYGLQKMDEMT
jgi:ABC-type bacteriocin/lantibiotic exporter with double-glycine peptidase domain